MYKEECKVTARIDKDLYEQVQEHFHHGQQTKLFRHFYSALLALLLLTVQACF